MDYTIFDVQDAEELFRAEKYDESLEILLQVHKQAVEQMQESSFVAYYIAICYDSMGDSLEAAFWINKATHLDPYNIRYEGAAGVIYENITRIIERESLAVEYSIKVENLYKFLKDNGRVGSWAQFSMIRFYMKHQKYNQAKAMLDNLLERNPNDKEALILRKKIARVEGDVDTLEKLSLVELNNLAQLKEVSGVNQ